MSLPWLAKKRLWFAGFLCWAAYLFTLSSNPGSVTGGAPQIPNIDKILHFGFFMGGAGLFTTWLLLWKGQDSLRVIRIVLPIALLCVIAAFDEIEQSFSPGRSGNDPLDWLADAIGSVSGVLLANRFHFILRKISSNRPNHTK